MASKIHCPLCPDYDHCMQGDSGLCRHDGVVFPLQDGAEVAVEWQHEVAEGVADVAAASRTTFQSDIKGRTHLCRTVQKGP